MPSIPFPKSFFTTQDLLDLMVKSPTIRGMKPAQIYAITKFALRPNSASAMNIYRVLKEEKMLIGRVEKNFDATMNQIMEKAANGITEIKLKAQQKKRQTREKADAKSEQDQTKKLLDSLKNK